MKTCKQCGTELRDNALFCSKCGAKQEEAKRCKHCGTELQPDDLFCDHCGTRVGEPEKSDSEAKPSGPAMASKICLPNKEYITFNRILNIAAMEDRERFKLLQKKRLEYQQYQMGTELGSAFWNDCFIVLEDGTMVGFRQGHTQKYAETGAENHRFNLYRLDPDGVAVFLDAGTQGGMENMFVLNGVAYCSWGAVHLQTKIF